MKVVSLEDARRVFLATVKLIYLNDGKGGVKTFELSRNEDRINLPNNSGDVVNIPSRKFKEALAIIIKQMGLHPEQKTAFVETFIELHWIMRPKDQQKRRYKKTTTSRCKVGGKEAAVFRIDRIIFDFLEDMNGVVVTDISNQEIAVPQRNPDGGLVTVNGSTQPTTVTTGTVCDARYNAAIDRIKRGIAEKERAI